MSLVDVMPRTPDSDESEGGDVVSITVRFPAAVRDDLKKQAKLEERAFNTVVIRAVRAYLEREKKGGR